MATNPIAPAGGNPLSVVLDILGSKGGQTAIQGLGAGLQAYGASKDRAAQRDMYEQSQAQSAEQFAANMAQRQHEQDQGQQLSQASSFAGASPLGAEQSFAQKQAILGQLLGGARNFSATPGDPRIAAAMGAGPQGGIRLPEGGLDPAMIQRLFGDNATLASLAARQGATSQLNPNAPQMQLGALFGDAGADASAGIAAASKQLADKQAAETARQRSIIMRALDEDIRGQKQAAQQKPSKAKSALGGAASGAMTGASLGSIVPGIGTGIGAAVGGIGGLLKGLF